MEKRDINSFMKSIFFGQIREDLLFPYPEVNAETSESVQMIIDTLQKFAADQFKTEEWDEKGGMPREIVQSLAEMGLLGIAVPEDLGGLGLPQSGYARIMQEMAGIDASIATTMGAHQSIGYKAVMLFGTDEQKKKYLPRLASGELLACYCLTEPGAGSDAASLKTKATILPDGSYEITGQKLWITNGEIANFMTVFAKIEVEENGEKREKVSGFIVELPAEGVSIGPAEHKLGIRASWTNAVYFDKVKVPKENILVGPGKGFKVAMGVLNHGRLGLAAGSIGLAKECLKHSIAHCNERRQFKKHLREFEMIQDKIGRLTTQIYAAESMVYMTTHLIDRGDVDYSLESAIAKIFCSEMSWMAVDENLQIWGGAGYMKEYPYERWMRDARIQRIFEGTNEILRAFVALSGMQGPGEELAGLAGAIQYPLQGLGLVGDYLGRRVRQSIVGESIEKAHPALKKEAGMIEEFAVELNQQIDNLLRKYGKKVHLKQFAQKRIADVAIDLFAMSCILSRVTARIQEVGSPEKCELDVSIAEAFFHQASDRIQSNFRHLSKNSDHYVKFIAETMFEKETYPFDLVLKK